jgi:hypothetical protein
MGHGKQADTAEVEVFAEAYEATKQPSGGPAPGSRPGERRNWRLNPTAEHLKTMERNTQYQPPLKPVPAPLPAPVPGPFHAVHAWAKLHGWPDNDADMVDRQLTAAGYTDSAVVVARLETAIQSGQRFEPHKLATLVAAIGPK